MPTSGHGRRRRGLWLLLVLGCAALLVWAFVFRTLLFPGPARIPLPTALAGAQALLLLPETLPPDAQLHVVASAALRDAVDAETFGINEPVVRYSYPGIAELEAAATGPIYELALLERERLSMRSVHRFDGIPQERALEILQQASVAQQSVPIEVAGWEGLALPPSWGAGSPLVLWKGNALVFASAAGDAEMLISLLSNAPSRAAATAGIFFDRHGNAVRRVGIIERDTGIMGMRPVLALYELPREDSPETEATPVPDAPLEYIGTFSEVYAPGEFLFGVWPHEAWKNIRGMPEKPGLHHWEKLYTQEPVSEPGAPVGSIQGALRREQRDIRSAAPLVTQTAWSILAAQAVYLSNREEAAAFRNTATPFVVDSATFLTQWRRGPDPVPLSTLDEQSGPNDIYPVLMAYLGLGAAMRWVGEEAVPPEWRERLEELSIELSARLLQEGQCLSCPAVVMPLVREAEGIPAALFAALEALPACPPTENPHGVLPHCAAPAERMGERPAL